MAQAGLNPLMILIPQPTGAGGLMQQIGFPSLEIGLRAFHFLLMKIPFLSSLLSCLDFLLNAIMSLNLMQ